MGTSFKELDAMMQGAETAGRGLMGDSDAYRGYRKIQEMTAVIGFASAQANKASAQAVIKAVEKTQSYADSAIASNSVAAQYQRSGMPNQMIQSDIASRLSSNQNKINEYKETISKAYESNRNLDYANVPEGYTDRHEINIQASGTHKENLKTIREARESIDMLEKQNSQLSKASADFNTLNRANEQSRRLDSARADISAGQQNARYVRTIAVNKMFGGSFIGDAYNTMNAVRMVSSPLQNMHHKSVEAGLKRRMAFDERAKAGLDRLALRATPGSGVERMLNRASGRFSGDKAEAAERIRRSNMRRTRAGRKKLADDDRARRNAANQARRRQRQDVSYKDLKKQQGKLKDELNNAFADARNEFALAKKKGKPRNDFYKSPEYRRYEIKYSKKRDEFNKLSDKLDKMDRKMQRRAGRDARKAARMDRKNRRAIRKANRKAFFAKLRELNPINIIKSAVSKVIGVIIGFLLQIVLYVAMGTGAMVIIAFFIIHFASDMINGMRTDLAGSLDNSQNWCQLILDHLYYDMGQEFEQVIKDDSFSHYFTYYYVVSPYYNVPMSVDYSTFGHSWVWEESDNTSRWVTGGEITDIGEEDGYVYGNPLYTVNEGVARTYDSEGKLESSEAVTWQEGMGESLNTYININEDNAGIVRDELDFTNSAELRTEVNPRLNVFPIIAMMHTKYIDNLNYEEWVTALAYTYYMYAMSHDVAKYDSNNSFTMMVPSAGMDTDYLAMQEENEGMSGYSVHTFFHGDRQITSVQGSSVGLRGPGIVYTDSDYMGTGQRVYFFNNNAWNRRYGAATTNCDNIFYHSAAVDADGNKNGSSGQTNDDGSHINGIYCETNVKLVQLFRRAVYEYIYSSSGNTQFAGYQNYEGGNFDYAMTVSFLHQLATGEMSSFRGTDKAALCAMMGITESELDAVYMPPGDTAHSLNQVGVTVNGAPDVMGYDFTFGDRTFTHNDNILNACSNYRVINLEDTVPTGECACNGNGHSCNTGVIYDEKYHALLHNGACLVAHGVDTGVPFVAGESGCGWVYTCGSPTNDTDAEGNGKHTHDKDGNMCSGYWQCNCGKYSITDTVYVCPGHCAGHIVPSTTTIQRLSYEGLAQGDGFKTTYWLTEEDIMGENAATDISETIFGLGRILGEADDAVMELSELRTNIMLKYGTVSMPTLPEWKLFWLKRAQGWFSIFPSSGRAFFTVIGKRFIYAVAGGIDFFTNNLADFLENVFVNHTGVLTAIREYQNNELEFISEALRDESANPMDEETLGDNDARDKLGFQGWFAPTDGEFATEYNRTAMTELKTFYGSFYDDEGNIIYRDPQRGFMVGVENWKEFDVYFPEELLNTLASP